jgi:hypothetical protein
MSATPTVLFPVFGDQATTTGNGSSGRSCWRCHGRARPSRNARRQHRNSQLSFEPAGPDSGLTRWPISSPVRGPHSLVLRGPSGDSRVIEPLLKRRQAGIEE